MIRITIPYFSMDDDTGFLKIKQWVIDNQVWKAAFFTHVFTSIVLLFAGFTQFSNSILKSRKQMHRLIGKTYIVIILTLSGPAGFVLSIFANGGWISQIAFISLSVLWISFTAIAYKKALRKEFNAHSKFMIRSYALTLSALTLRAWKYLIVLVIQPPPMDLYRTVAWLGWVPNLLLAEYIIYKKYGKKHLRTGATQE